MNPDAMYTLARGGHQYGPFTLEQLRDQYNQGSVEATDLIWCPGMAAWSPVGEVLGPAVAPGAPPPLEPQAPRAPVPPPATVSRSEDAAFPKPPSLHWALVLLFTVLTCGLFGLVWMFVHAVWVRRIDPTCNALFVLAVGIPLQIVVGLDGHELLASLVGAVAATWAYFMMRSVIEARFGIALSAVMTFFFNELYLQYHMTAIAEGEHALRTRATL
jgi:hypothetical protein